MEFSKHDMIILLTMTVAIICLSFTLPALGMAGGGDSATESDIPEFNLTTDRFDFAGEFPDSPGTPSSGELEIDNSNVEASDNFVDLGNGTSMTLFDGPDMQMGINNIDASGGDDVYFNNSEVGDIQTLEAFGYEIDAELLSVENEGESDFTWSVRWEIEDQPSDSGFISRIPIVGGVVSIGESLASMVGWIGSIIFWFVGTVVTTVTNLIVVLIDIVTFFISLLHWMLSTYLGYVSAADGFASVFLMVPGILLFLEFAKLGMITVDMLWIG